MWRGNGKSSNRENQIFLDSLKMLCLYSLDKLFAGLRQVAAHIELSTWPKTVTMRLKLPNHLKRRVLGRHHQNCRPSFNIKKIVENIQCYIYDTYANLSCFWWNLTAFNENWQTASLPSLWTCELAFFFGLAHNPDFYTIKLLTDFVEMKDERNKTWKCIYTNTTNTTSPILDGFSKFK